MAITTIILILITITILSLIIAVIILIIPHRYTAQYQSGPSACISPGPVPASVQARCLGIASACPMHQPRPGV